ncbi:MAG: hypothetical protein CML41_03775 [Rhodobacteraceae bacterium]|jgi:hypothetical protein|nr:hypothetical protein [Paracoccaceae bacterium]|tara:strand:+ start:27 stop:275 length:249 start_codon:yes stop_codon:yes gene_type:complete
MNIVANVSIARATFEEWSTFYDSYRSERHKYVENEQIEKVSDVAAKISFTITDMDGLTKLSSSPDILKEEERLGVTVKIVEE